MPLLKKIFIIHVQSLAAVMKIAKFIVHIIGILKLIPI